MMSSNNIIDVNEVDFEYEVIAYSQNSPVLVDFWAEWCQPCKTLSPLLERLTAEAQGGLRLAKVNIDQNPNLAQMFNVRSIPTVKAFTQGHVVAEFTGIQPEERLRDFIAKIVPPSAVDLEIEKGENLLTLEKWTEAEIVFRQALTIKPESPPALLGLTKSLLALGYGEEALQNLSDFPASRELSSAERLLPFANTLVKYQSDSLPMENDLDIAFANSIRLAGSGKLAASLDGLLDILRQDKRYRNKLAQEVVLGLLEILGVDNPQTKAYRVELSSMLF
jgi:putative thioredoxin